MLRVLMCRVPNHTVLVWYVPVSATCYQVRVSILHQVSTTSISDTAVWYQSACLLQESDTSTWYQYSWPSVSDTSIWYQYSDISTYLIPVYDNRVLPVVYASTSSLVSSCLVIRIQGKEVASEKNAVQYYYCLRCVIPAVLRHCLYDSLIPTDTRHPVTPRVQQYDTGCCTQNSKPRPFDAAAVWYWLLYSKLKTTAFGHLDTADIRRQSTSTQNEREPPSIAGRRRKTRGPRAVGRDVASPRT